MSRLLSLPVTFAAALAATLAATPPGFAEPIGDVEAGKKAFRECRSCHKVGDGARNGVGPHLNDLFGRAAGSIDGYRYSKALLREGAAGLEWHLDTLHAYIENPKALVSKTRMNYRGMKDEGKRADLLAYLRVYSDDPQNIPEADPTAIGTDHAVDPEILAIQGDPEYGEYLSSECTSCHRRDGSDDGIPSITNWPTEDFVVAMHAYKDKIRPHPVMQMMAGRLNNEEIAALAAYFEAIE